MSIQDQSLNKEQENDGSQPSASENHELPTNGEVQNQQAKSPESESLKNGQDERVPVNLKSREIPPVKKKTNGPRLLRNFFGELVNPPGWRKAEKKLQQLENFFENYFNEEDDGQSK